MLLGFVNRAGSLGRESESGHDVCYVYTRWNEGFAREAERGINGSRGVVAIESGRTWKRSSKGRERGNAKVDGRSAGRVE